MCEPVEPADPPESAEPGQPANSPRERKLPSERDWERAEELRPRPAARHPELVSDGAALAFPLRALAQQPTPLDEGDPAVQALRQYVASRAKPKRSSRVKRGDAPDAQQQQQQGVEGWRVLAREEGEVLFGLGVPPRLLLVTMRKRALRGWTCTASGMAKSLRAAREGIRASSWRVDPTHEAQEDDTTLRVLLTEQAFAGGQSAEGRVLEPELYMDEEELVLRLFVSPRPGYQMATRNPETPVRVALRERVGARRLVDGALVFDSSDSSV